MISYANPHELETVIEMCLEGAKEYDFEGNGHAPPDREVVADYMYQQWRVVPCIILKDEDRIVGFCGLSVANMWWTREPHLFDYRTYILPCHRSMDNVKLLYGAAKAFARSQGMRFISEMLSSDDRMDVRRRMMRRIGFIPTGFTFSYDGRL